MQKHFFLLILLMLFFDKISPSILMQPLK